MVCAFKYSQILHICTEIATMFYGLVKSVKWNSEDILVFKSNLYIIYRATLVL